MPELDRVDGDPSQEMVDHVAADGSVIETVPRWKMRRDRLAHRATYIVQLAIDPATIDLVDVDPVTADPREADRGGLRSACGVDGEYATSVEAWFANLRWNQDPTSYDGIGPRLDTAGELGQDTQIVVHKRADWKDLRPSYWDIAFGGVCGAGEPWLSSARREFSEEAGIDDALIVPIGAGRYDDPKGVTLGAIFVAVTAVEPQPDDGEVVAIDYVRAGDLVRWSTGRDVCPDSLSLVLPILSRLSPGMF